MLVEVAFELTMGPPGVTPVNVELGAEVSVVVETPKVITAVEVEVGADDGEEDGET